MTERPIVKCGTCGSRMFKLISTGTQVMGMAGGRGLYDFVDINTTGQPVRIHNKRQWKEHLKKHGLNDDVKNSPMTKSDLEGMDRKEQHKKDYRRKEIKSSLRKLHSTTTRAQRVAAGIKAVHGKKK